MKIITNKYIIYLMKYFWTMSCSCFQSFFPIALINIHIQCRNQIYKKRANLLITGVIFDLVLLEKLYSYAKERSPKKLPVFSILNWSYFIKAYYLLTHTSQLISFAFVFQKVFISLFHIRLKIWFQFFSYFSSLQKNMIQ